MIVQQVSGFTTVLCCFQELNVPTLFDAHLI
jgi:hypothetical protein